MRSTLTRTIRVRLRLAQGWLVFVPLRIMFLSCFSWLPRLEDSEQKPPRLGHRFACAEHPLASKEISWALVAVKGWSCLTCRSSPGAIISFRMVRYCKELHDTGTSLDAPSGAVAPFFCATRTLTVVFFFLQASSVFFRV